MNFYDPMKWEWEKFSAKEASNGADCKLKRRIFWVILKHSKARCVNGAIKSMKIRKSATKN